MTRSDIVSPADRVLTIGPRGLDVLRLLWEHGPATVRQLLTWLTSDPPLTYMNIMTVCVRLVERGLLERRLAANADEAARYGKAYVYTPMISEDEFLRTAVRQQSEGNSTRLLATGGDQARIEQALAYLGMLHGVQDQRIDDVVLQRIAGLLERAETAERAAVAWQARAHHAELLLEATERRAKTTQRRAEEAERRVQTLLQQMNRPPKPQRKPPVPFGTVTEHRSPLGICRVCGQKAPPPSAARRDDLRVCKAETCRQEARRRDDAAKQRRYNARQSAARKRV
jgi:predicted transcriptional regulator